MELRHVRYFVALAEELHFGRAAQRLRISQPPLSQQIRALEEEVGARLFERTRHKVRLTKPGEAMLEEAYRLLEQSERVRIAAREARARLSTRLSIGCVSSAFFDVLPPILDRLHIEHPEIALSLREYESATAATAVHQGTLDVAFIRIERLPSPLKMRPLRQDRFIAALPARHVLTRGKRVSLRSLAGEPLVIYSRKVSPLPHDAIIAACHKLGFSPTIAYESGSVQNQIGFVACGLGIALVPKVIERWRIPGVVYRELDKPIRATDLSLVWNAESLTTATELLLNTAQRVFQPPDGSDNSLRSL